MIRTRCAGLCVVLVVSWLAGRTAATALPAPECAGDCDTDGEVEVTELITGVGIALGDMPAASCDAMDRDEDGQVNIGEVLAAVGSSLRGCGEGAPTATPTPTSTPTVIGTSVAQTVMQEVADPLCWDMFRVVDTTVHCDALIGHVGRVTLTGFADEQQAVEAFGSKTEDENEEVFLGSPLRIDSRPAPCCESLGGVIQQWRWRNGCWIVSGYVFDDTSYRLGPQPHESIEIIVEAADHQGLFESCLSP